MYIYTQYVLFTVNVRYMYIYLLKGNPIGIYAQR